MADKRKRNDYSFREKIQLLDRYQGMLHLKKGVVAQELGIPLTTLTDWLTKEKGLREHLSTCTSLFRFIVVLCLTINKDEMPYRVLRVYFFCCYFQLFQLFQLFGCSGTLRSFFTVKFV